MQIVIEISDTLKNIVDTGDAKTFSHLMWRAIVMDAIKNGTPLPKGHGRLIDADAMFEDVKNYCIDPDAHDWTIFDFINNADTIIKADMDGWE